jgi:surface polysaccharide O-acyltransferase-like enzyme
LQLKRSDPAEAFDYKTWRTAMTDLTDWCRRFIADRQIQHWMLQWLMLAWFLLMGFISMLVVFGMMALGMDPHGGDTPFLGLMCFVCQIAIFVCWLTTHASLTKALDEAYPEFKPRA